MSVQPTKPIAGEKGMNRNTESTSYSERIIELEEEILVNRRERNYARLDRIIANKKLRAEEARIIKAQLDLTLAEKELKELLSQSREKKG